MSHEIAKALGDKKTVILQNHGLLTTGTNVDVAVWLFISISIFGITRFTTKWSLRDKITYYEL